MKSSTTTRLLTTMLIESARQNPDVTLAELVALAKRFGVGLKMIRVRDFLDGTLPRSTGGPHAAHAIPKYRIVVAHSTRTPEERKALDASVRNAIAEEGTWVRAEPMRRKHFPRVSPLQFRKAVNRLIKARKLKVQGQARGREYRA